MIKVHYTEFGSFLKKTRLKKGMTIVECSKLLGSKKGNPSAWARYENDDCLPSLHQVARLLKVLGCENAIVRFDDEQ